MPRNGSTTRPRPRPRRPRAAPAPPPAIFYGWRYVTHRGPDGQETLCEVPLTLEDVLYPQEGDVIPEAPLQERERGYLAGVARTQTRKLRRLPDVEVLSDCLIDWNVPGVRNHSPDLAVLEGVQVPHEPHRGTFRVAVSGGRPRLNLELVSPSTRNNDVVHKLRDYHRVHVPIYVIVDQETEGGPRTLRGYRWRRQGYVQMRLDSQGRLRLRDLGILLGLENNRVVCYDLETGELIGDYTQLSESLTQEREVRERAEAAQRAETAARERAEAAQRAETAARERAEAAQRAEAAARERAEAAQRAEAAARERAQAERQAALEAQQAAEQRLRELEERLRQQGGPTH